MQDVVEIINYYEHLVELWENWADTVERMYDTESYQIEIEN